MSILSFSQTNTFNIGIQGGPSISTISTKYDKKKFSDRDPSVVFMAGMFVQYNFSKNFALRMDPGFEQKGYNLTYTFTDPSGNILGDYKTTSRFNYITVPILFRASVGNKINYFINAGPYIGFLLSEKFKNDYDNSITNNTKYYHTADIGITAGIGLAVPINERFSFSIELRNNFGLYNISKSEDPKISVKTFSGNLLCGISYTLGK